MAMLSSTNAARRSGVVVVGSGREGAHVGDALEREVAAQPGQLQVVVVALGHGRTGEDQLHRSVSQEADVLPLLVEAERDSPGCMITSKKSLSRHGTWKFHMGVDSTMRSASSKRAM